MENNPSIKDVDEDTNNNNLMKTSSLQVEQHLVRKLTKLMTDEEYEDEGDDATNLLLNQHQASGISP